MALIIGYILCFIIGIVINLLGGGGSILSIPILVYVLGVTPYTATSYSLFLVGMSSWVATFSNMKSKTILYKQGLIFAAPTLLVTFLIRKYLIPKLPDIFIKTENLTLTKDDTIMLFFVIVMLLAGVSSIRGRKDLGDTLPKTYNYPLVFIQGIFVGIITGIVGAGGGFLIIPALVFLVKIPMKNAVATSLFIMAITTSLGFLADFESVEIDWSFLLTFTGVVMAGVLFSNPIKKAVSNSFLRIAFGYLVLIVAFIIVFMEVTK